MVGYLGRVIVLRRSAQKRLADVSAPASDATDYRRFVALVRDQTSAFEQLSAATAGGDRAAIAVANASVEETARQKNALAGRLGIEACAGA